MDPLPDRPPALHPDHRSVDPVLARPDKYHRYHAFDADLAADALGSLAGTPTLDAGHVKLWKPAVGHVAMIAAHSRIGYAGASIPVCWTLSKASAGVVQPSTRRGRWLSLAATELSWSWLNLPTSAFLCRYWRSSRLVFSLVPRCQG
jgi:hypothetical protein